MLREWRDVRQIEGEGFRRWFSDQDLDLIVWFDGPSQRSIVGFQLCYDKRRRERALTWKRDQGFSHNRIDDGEIPLGTKRTPILVADGTFARDKVKRLFADSAVQIEKRIVDFVGETLDTFPVAPAARPGDGPAQT